MINGNAASTNTRPVILTLSATDTATAVTTMRFSWDNLTWYGWEDFSTTRNAMIPAGVDGNKTIYVRFKDAVGNISPTYNDTIVLDTCPPTGTIEINGGAATTTSSAATLTLSANDSNGVSQMQFSKDGGVTWYAWEPYGLIRHVTLTPPGPGVKTVVVRYKDSAGNVSATFQASIIVQ